MLRDILSFKLSKIAKKIYLKIKDIKDKEIEDIKSNYNSITEHLSIDLKQFVFEYRMHEQIFNIFKNVKSLEIIGYTVKKRNQL